MRLSILLAMMLLAIPAFSQTSGLEFEIYVDARHRVLLEPEVYHKEFLKPFYNLSEENVKKFLVHREKVLSKTAEAFDRKLKRLPDGLYFGREPVIQWGSHPPKGSVIDLVKVRFLANYLENIDRQLFLNSQVIVEKKEFGINIAAVGSLLFWLPKKYLQQSGGRLPKGGAWSLNLVFAFDRMSKGLHLDFSVIRFRPERIFYLPGMEVGGYLYVAAFVGNDYFSESLNGPAVFNIASMVGYEASPQHRSAGVLLGHSQPPILSAASTYTLTEARRFDIVRWHVALVPVARWMRLRYQKLKRSISRSKCMKLLGKN